MIQVFESDVTEGTKIYLETLPECLFIVLARDDEPQAYAYIQAFAHA